MPHELLLGTRQKTNLINAFENIFSMSKTQISKMIQSGGFLEAILSRIADPLMKIEVSMAKNILALLGVTAAALAIDRGIQRKKHSSKTTTLINEEMNYIMKIVQALQIIIFYWKALLKQLKMKRKNKKENF